MKDTKKDAKKDAKNEDKEVLDVLYKCKPTTTKVSAPVKHQRRKTARGTFKTPPPAPAPAEQPAKKVAKYFQYKQCINNFVITKVQKEESRGASKEEQPKERLD